MPARRLCLQFVLLILTALTTAACDRNEAAPIAAPATRPAAPVTVATAISRDVPVYLEEIGKTAASEYVTLMPQLSGQIRELHFKDGADVKKGDLLFTLDPRPFEAALAQAQATLEMRKAEMDLARQEFKRVEDLVGTKAVSQQEYDTRKSAMAVAATQVQSAEAAVRIAQLNLNYCSIASPIDGRVGQRQVDVGNIVKANEQPLVVIQRLDPIYADFTISERALALVRKHMAAGTLMTQVWVPDDQSPREGTLTFLDTAVQSGAGTVKLRATLPNKDRRFWAGQFVQVRLVLETKKDAVLVPSQAIQIGQEGPYVYVVKDDQTAELRPITLGQRQGDLMVIDQGVAAGERVVVTGQMTVAPGAKVRIVEPATQPTTKE